MLARVRRATDDNDQGFTLIELLVVMIIIGILAAIAIPVFLNQRKKAVDSAVKSDLRTVATEMETVFADAQVYPTVSSAAGVATLSWTPAGGTAATRTVSLSTGNAVTSGTTADGAGTYCLLGARQTNASEASQSSWVYRSGKGGLQASGKTTCSA